MVFVFYCSRNFIGTQFLADIPPDITQGPYPTDMNVRPSSHDFDWMEWSQDQQWHFCIRYTLQCSRMEPPDLVYQIPNKCVEYLTLAPRLIHNG